jgi:SAM-dependent methyltransferase
VDDPTDLVRRGYDAIAPAFLDWHAEPGPRTIEHVRLLAAELRPNDLLLDLGCGPGTKTADLGAGRRFGVDVSAGQLAIACRLDPAFVVVQADIARPLFRPASFDAAVALFSIIHVPRERQAGVLALLAASLRPGAPFVATLGVGDNPGEIDDDWLGAPMYWSGFDAETNLRLLREAGFDLEDDAIEDVLEEGEPLRFLSVFARRRA